MYYMIECNFPVEICFPLVMQYNIQTGWGVKQLVVFGQVRYTRIFAFKLCMLKHRTDTHKLKQVDNKTLLYVLTGAPLKELVKT